MLYFITCFDLNYLSRGLTLLDSLNKRCSEAFILYVLALDDGVKEYFEINNIDNLQVITLPEVENHFPELERAKSNRSTIEYYFTLSPYLPLYILENYPEIDQITSMDADLYFFDDPATILKAYPMASILITPHDFSLALKYLEVFGKYNVSFQSFKNDDAGHLCLNNWRKKCFEWCGDYYDEINNRFADQKYLDDWIEKFPRVSAIEIPGAGVAPWNFEKYTSSEHEGVILVDNSPLIYFHFHHLRVFYRNFATNGLETYNVNVKAKAIKKIYHIYLKKLNSFFSNHINFEDSILRNNDNSYKSFKQKMLQPGGYWFFTKFNIFHVNLDRAIYKLKKSIGLLWPN